LRENYKKINWTFLSSNQSLDAIKLLKEHYDKINWCILSLNYYGVDLLQDNLDKIDWLFLSKNNNPKAISLLEKNIDKINWYYLSENTNAIHLLKNNPDKINYYYLSKNPSIFTYDYEEIKKNFEKLGEEIIQKALHPKRIIKLIEIYGEDEIYNNYFDDD